jgi:signal transduction histidine kinase/CheY-like chemotaxis protein
MEVPTILVATIFALTALLLGIGLFFFVRTRKELKASRQEHEKTYEHLQDAIECISDGFALWGTDDRLIVGNARVLEFLPEFTPYFYPGCKFETLVEVAGTTGLYAVPEDQLDDFKAERIARHHNPGEPFVHKLKDNRWVQIKERRTEDGCIVQVWTDLSELKSQEQQLLQAQKMEVVGQLTGGIAHDFNNLLTVVLGNLELMAEVLRTGKIEKITKLVMRATEAARRSATLTQRLLAFSRRQALQPEATDLKELIGGMADLLNRSLGEPITLKTSFDDSPWAVMVDPNQLESALLNLTINARDAMPNGGQLIIKTENVVISAEEMKLLELPEAGEYGKLSILDTGFGMSPETIERAFEPFYSTKDVGQGSGLGLSMVYGFVQQSGGQIRIDSEINKGTCVSLYLPKASDEPVWRKRSAYRKSAQTKRVNTENGGEHILVIEDEEMVRELAVNLLESCGYRVSEASDGENALSLLREIDHLDLVLSDVVLPGGMSGPEIVEAARLKRPGLRAIFMSGYTAQQSGHKVNFPRNEILLNKPFRKKDLVEKVRLALIEPDSSNLAEEENNLAVGNE